MKEMDDTNIQILKDKVDEFRIELAESAIQRIEGIIEICSRHPDICWPIYCKPLDIEDIIPKPDPKLVLGDYILQYLKSITSKEALQPVYGLETPSGVVVNLVTGEKYSTKVNPAYKAMQAVLSDEQNAKIAADKLEQTIKANENIVAIQKNLLTMTKKRIQG